MISRAKHNRFRKAMDFENYKARMMEADSLEALAAFVKPLFGLKMRKTLPLSQLDDLLTCKIEEAAEKSVLSPGEHGNIFMKTKPQIFVLRPISNIF